VLADRSRAANIVSPGCTDIVQDCPSYETCIV
jgi:hypothetical protein